jgi:oligoribonuclease
VLGVFLDSETNGLDWSKHTILEICFIIKNLITGEKVDSYNALIIPNEEEWRNSDVKSLAYTKISLDALKTDGKERLLVRQEILSIFKRNNIVRGKAVFICQNPSFDRVFFSRLVEVDTQERLLLPYYWLDLASMYWSKRIAEKPSSYTFSISKDGIAKHFNIADEEKPHRAEAGVKHLIECYNSVVGFPKKDSQERV